MVTSLCEKKCVKMYDEYFTNVSNHSFEEFADTARIALKQITSNPDVICNLLRNIASDPVLAEKTECYDFLDKMVVYSNDDLGIYTRVSFFYAGYGERIHYHRWNYASCILCGGYTQTLYGTVKEPGGIDDITTDDIILREELYAGNSYALESSTIHSVRVLPNTISICIRGEALRDSFQVKDISTGRIWRQYGSAAEALEERSIKRMPQFLLKEKIEEICKMIKSL